MRLCVLYTPTVPNSYTLLYKITEQAKYFQHVF